MNAAKISHDIYTFASHHLREYTGTPSVPDRHLSTSSFNFPSKSSHCTILPWWIHEHLNTQMYVNTCSIGICDTIARTQGKSQRRPYSIVDFKVVKCKIHLHPKRNLKWQPTAMTPCIWFSPSMHRFISPCNASTDCSYYSILYQNHHIFIVYKLPHHNLSSHCFLTYLQQKLL